MSKNLSKFIFQTCDPSGHMDRMLRNLPDASAARCEAAKTLGAIICDSGHKADANGKFRITVRDGDGALVFALQVQALEGDKYADQPDRVLA